METEEDEEITIKDPKICRRSKRVIRSCDDCMQRKDCENTDKEKN